MGNIFNEDFIDFLNALNIAEVKYVLVGGYSVIIHGYSRTTGDLDILVERTKENYKKIENAFSIFRMPLFDMTEDNFLYNNEMDVYTFGRQPVAIDIMNKIKGATFEELFAASNIHNVDGVNVRLIHLNNLIQTKKVAGRHKDLDDIQNLTDSK
jgi:predicted nucleotidyltransferase